MNVEASIAGNPLTGHYPLGPHPRGDLLVVTNTNEAVTELNPAAASLL
jgi:hypothetical protein